MQTLIRAEEAHHRHLLVEIDRFPAFADGLDHAPSVEVQQQLDAFGAFLGDVLLPHIDAQEAKLYPQFERILQNRHSMKPMLREHAQIRELVAELRAFHVRGNSISASDALALRRLLYRLYGLLKVHLAEEQLYAAILEHNVAEDQAQELATAMQHAGFTEL